MIQIFIGYDKRERTATSLMIPRSTTYYNSLHLTIPQKYKSAANLYGYPLIKF